MKDKKLNLLDLLNICPDVYIKGVDTILLWDGINFSVFAKEKKEYKKELYIGKSEMKAYNTFHANEMTE